MWVLVSFSISTRSCFLFHSTRLNLNSNNTHGGNYISTTDDNIFQIIKEAWLNPRSLIWPSSIWMISNYLQYIWSINMGTLHLIRQHYKNVYHETRQRKLSSLKLLYRNTPWNKWKQRSLSSFFLSLIYNSILPHIHRTNTMPAFTASFRN